MTKDEKALLTRFTPNILALIVAETEEEELKREAKKQLIANIGEEDAGVLINRAYKGIVED